MLVVGVAARVEELQQADLHACLVVVCGLVLDDLQGGGGGQGSGVWLTKPRHVAGAPRAMSGGAAAMPYVFSRQRACCCASAAD
eukprot:364374-Chlamydomonas_euryale.AAC.1